MGDESKLILLSQLLQVEEVNMLSLRGGKVNHGHL